MVAVKMIKIGSNSNFALIQQEIVFLKNCSHPNIISYFGSYFHKDSLAIVMQYCSGGSLHDMQVFITGLKLIYYLATK